MCDACQSAKNHQLPFPKSSSVSKAPLELVFLDVWGPAPSYVRKNKYYMSFIDDYSKFTWIFLLKNKYEVFDKFHISQQHIERLLNRKIISMQTDWGGEYQRLNSFFLLTLVYLTLSHALIHTNRMELPRGNRLIVEVGLSLLSQACMPP
jgi:hypothetical protein